MKRDYEVVVLGLGGIGSGALYWLSRSLGGEVLGVERFELGHERGSSQDLSRIIRYSYHTPAYVRFARAAYEAWAAVEREAGEELVVRTGGLDLFPPGGSIPAADYTGSLESCGVPFELLDAAEIARRWPVWRLPPGTTGLFQADGGFVRAAAANAAHRRLARAQGAVVWDRAPVTAIRAAEGALDLTVQREDGPVRLRCGRLVVAAGAWSQEVLGLSLPLTVTQEQVVWFAPAPGVALEPGRFPVWIWMDEPSFYGFPALAGAGVKVAQDVGGREVTAETRSFEPDPENSARVESFCRRALPEALGELRGVKTCLYTLTPDRDFVIDRLPGRERIVLAIGAGHAFKFASVIGRVLSELALDGTTPVDLAPFRISRPLLRQTDPPRRFIV